MIVHVRIERDGAVLDTLTLGQGEHSIGRAEDNAVILADKAVSSRHALLRVHETEVELLDQGSLNGIFVDGEKVAKVAFSRALTADLCGLRLVLTAKAAPKKHYAFLSTAAMGTRPALLLATAALALGVFFAAWLPARNAFDALARRETLQRGALLARSLAEQNVVPLQAKLLDQLRIASVAAEEGVRQAVVTDPYGKVLAPGKDLGKVQTDPQLGKAGKEQGLSIWTGPEGDVVLACPIRSGQDLLGLALVYYRPELAFAPLDRAGGTALGLVVALLLWAAAAWAILRTALRPIRIVAEDIGVALKSGSRELAIAPASVEMVELKRAVERLLVLAPASGPGYGEQGLASMASSVPVPTASPSAQPACATPGESDGAAWCQLDLASYQLTGWSPAFAGHLRVPDMLPPVHLLSSLADPDVLAAVAGALDDPAEDAVRRIENQALMARKEPGPQPGTVRVCITEAT